MMKGVFLDAGSVDRGDMDFSSLQASLDDLQCHEATTGPQVVQRLGGAQVAISNKVIVDGSVLAACPDLQLVCVAATGTNNVDVAAAARRGIAVCNVRGYATSSVVQHAFAMLLSLMRSLSGYRDAVAGGRWASATHFCLLDFPIEDLSGKCMGIIGYGELGRAVARTAEAFGMEVRIAARPGQASPERMALADLLPLVDVLSLHVPLTPETRNIIGEKELAAMKPGAILINTARGGLVDEHALAEALRRGRLGGAAVDVLSDEPPRRGNPLLQVQAPNLIVTPHVAWASRRARQCLLDEVAANIRAFRAGQVRNRVESGGG